MNSVTLCCVRKISIGVIKFPVYRAQNLQIESENCGIGFFVSIHMYILPPSPTGTVRTGHLSEDGGQHPRAGPDILLSGDGAAPHWGSDWSGGRPWAGPSLELYLPLTRPPRWGRRWRGAGSRTACWPPQWSGPAPRSSRSRPSWRVARRPRQRSVRRIFSFDIPTVGSPDCWHDHNSPGLWSMSRCPLPSHSPPLLTLGIYEYQSRQMANCLYRARPENCLGAKEIPTCGRASRTRDRMAASPYCL